MQKVYGYRAIERRRRVIVSCSSRQRQLVTHVLLRYPANTFETLSA